MYALFCKQSCLTSSTLYLICHFWFAPLIIAFQCHKLFMFLLLESWVEINILFFLAFFLLLFCVDYIQLFYTLSGFVFEQGSTPLVNLSFINRLYVVNSGFSLIQKPWHQDIIPWQRIYKCWWLPLILKYYMYIPNLEV